MNERCHSNGVLARYSAFIFFIILLAATWVNDCSAVERTDLNGTVTYGGNPVCTMVLANGKHQFTCSGDGSFNLAGVPFDSNDEITLYAFCSGLAPYKAILKEGSTDFEIVMSADPGGQQPVVTVNTIEGSTTKTGWYDIAGTIETATGTPLIAMALANGKYMFTSNPVGEFSLSVPADSNSEITLYGFCSGFLPYKKIIETDYDPDNIDNDGDGYTENEGDCDDTDATIHPSATEVCGDGIDQDCDGNDKVCEPDQTYVLEDFNNGTDGFYAYDPFSLSNDRLAFHGDGTPYTYFTAWNGGNNPSLNWYPQSGDSNYFDDFNASVVTYWDGGSNDYPYFLSICTRKNNSGDLDAIEFDLVKDGYYAIYKVTNGSYENLVSWTPSFLPNIDGQANKLSVEKENNSFRFFINDIEVEQLSIDGVTGGGLGIGSTEMDDVSFDDFKVTDPFEGQLVIPSSGYLEKLKELVYKVMTTTYLWYDTVPAVDLAAYSSAEALLDDLRYDELDKWSYITPKEEYDDLMEEGQYIGVGIGIKYADSGELWINFVYRNSPAATAGLMRGDRILEINGKTIEEIETDDLWDTAFGDDEVGIPVTLKIVDHTGVTRELSLEKDRITMNTVLFSDVLNVDNLKIGYLVFNDFIGDAQDELDTVFADFSQEKIDELILDLRYNTGGLVGIAQHLAELIAGENLNGGVFADFVHNDKYSAWDATVDFETVANSLNLDRVFVITTGDTCSASELLINSLRPFIDVVVVGDTTCGKPVGMIGYDLFDMHISPIEFKTLNADGVGEYYDGIEPTCHSEDDLTRQFGNTQESSLLKALNYVRYDSCTSEALSSGRMKAKGHRKVVPLKGFRREIGAF